MSRKDKKFKKAFFAVFAVALMLMSSVIVLAGGSDADTWQPNETGDYYSYTLEYHADRMGETAQQSYQLTVDGTTPISHAPGTTTLSAVADEGSWGFDRTTGIGPFNSFYGAFDMTAGNRFFAVLNPYDLTQTIDGVALDPIANYNIMWVLPTVYWSTDENGNVTLTNDPSAGGTAYAHTIDGKIRQYVAYGVYKGSTKTIDEKTVLTSQSGATPTGSQTRAVFREQAHNYAMDTDLGASDGTPGYGMLWNFYQWTLYKLVAYTVMEGFNSQMLVGNGNVYGGNYTMANGLTDALGPYAGNPGTITSTGYYGTDYGRDAVKLFIENAWGTVCDLVDGVTTLNPGLYIDTSSNPSDSTTLGENIDFVTYTLSHAGYGTNITTNEKIWGMPLETSTSTSNYVIGTTDWFNRSAGARVLDVGGYSANPTDGLQTTVSIQSGISWSYFIFQPSEANLTVGARLAFVYGDVYTPTTITISPSDPSLGSVEPTEISAMTGDTITIDGNTLTIGTQTITASPAEGYYAIWMADDAIITDGATVTADMVISVVFEELPPVPSPEKTLAKFIPLIVILGIIMLAASAIASFRGTGFDMVKLMVGLAVCVLVLVYALLPATGGI